MRFLWVVSFFALAAAQHSQADDANCTPFNIDFSIAANDTTLKNGDYVQDEWLDYGMKVKAVAARGGGYTPGGKARIFDTTIKSKEDPDLNSPNRRCRPISGFGRGKGGGPGQPGENCNPKGEGNLLIIQEKDKAAPDDYMHGGRLTFDFDPPTTGVISVGLMDIENTEQAHFEIHTVKTILAASPPIVRAIVGLGGNSIQEELIDVQHVTSLVLVSTSSFGVRFMNYCQERTPSPPSSSPPTLSPSQSATTQSPTLSPTAIATPTGPTDVPTTLSPTLSPTTVATQTGPPTDVPATLSPTLSPTNVATPTGPTDVPTTYAPTSSPAVATPPRINEILYLPNTDPFTSTPEERLAFVEVFRPDTSFDLARCALVNAAGQAIDVWENQTDVDGAHVVTFLEDDFLNVTDGLALYCDSEMVDYVAWCQLDFGPSGAVYDEAVNLGIWSSSDCFYTIALEADSSLKQRPVIPGDSIGRDANATNTHSPTDWYGTGGIDGTGPSRAAPNLAKFSSTASTPLSTSLPKAKWTVMTYSCLDHLNNGGSLELVQMNMRQQLKDFGRIYNPDLDDKVHFVFQQDHYRAHFSNATWEDPNVTHAGQDVGATLKDFITWAKTYFPAERYLLHLEGHGKGW
jgi:hypothetical protein